MAPRSGSCLHVSVSHASTCQFLMPPRGTLSCLRVALSGSRPSTADSTTSNTSTASIPPPQWHLTTQKYMTCLPVTVFMLLVTMSVAGCQGLKQAKTSRVQGLFMRHGCPNGVFTAEQCLCKNSISWQRPSLVGVLGSDVLSVSSCEPLLDLRSIAGG